VKPAAKAKPSGEAQGRVIYIGTSVWLQPPHPPRLRSRAGAQSPGHIPHGFYEEQMRGARASLLARS